MSFAAALVLGLTARAAAAAPAAPRRAPDIALIVVDALRADALGAYGSRSGASPALDAFAREAAVFENAFVQAPWTLPALGSLMTSLLPRSHGAVALPPQATWVAELDAGKFTPGAGGRLPEGSRTLARALRARGYETVGVVSGAFPRSEFGFAQGFDEYHDDGALLGALEDRLIFPILRRERAKPLFLYVHAGDVHDPYTSPARAGEADDGYRGPLDGTRDSLDALDERVRRGRPPTPAELAHLRRLYERGVAYEDGRLGPLLDKLRAAGAVVVVTADHGEGFYEHGLLRHGRSLYDEVLRVPLLLRLPGGAARRVPDVVRAIDLFPTLLEAAGLAPEPGLSGRSVLPLARGGALPERPAVSERPGVAASLRTRRWKYVRGPGAREQLFDLRADPGERYDLAASTASAAVLGGLRASLDAELGPPPASAPGPGAPRLTEATRERLRASGYVK